MQMAFFWANNAAIALRQFFKTGKTITLIETFFRHAIAVCTANNARVLQTNTLPNVLIHRHTHVIQKQSILRRRTRRYLHFIQAALVQHRASRRHQHLNA
jgi:hypothetical protein